MPETTYELFALKYATHPERRVHDNFIFRDLHDGPMPIDFFVWVARSAERTFVIDTGFDAPTARRRERHLVRPVADAVRSVGVDPEDVEDVIITHLHNDHAGDLAAFPRARLHLQDREMAFATGRHMCHARLRAPFEEDHVVDMVRKVYGGRVAFHDGVAELAPGLSVHRVGGHSDGLQVVRAWTTRGWVVLASDATHFYANMETGNPFPIVFNIGDMLEGHRTCLRLADSPAHVVPGHDPLVLERYPPPSPELEGSVARLDVAPRD